MFFKRKQHSYKITIVENGRTQIYKCSTKKEKNQWLYDYIMETEKVWVWQEYNESNYSSVEKWLKDYLQPQWKESSMQFLRINKKIILIKQENI